MMKRIMIIAMAAAIAATSCGERKTEKKDISPEAVVETFNRALTAGDFDKARALCDSTSMNGWLEGYARTWKDLENKDGNALSIASAILSEAGFEVEKIEKTDGGRAVHYRIEAEGTSKRKRAELKKEEGEWKITSIADSNLAE
jgi:hypothetical protein